MNLEDYKKSLKEYERNFLQLLMGGVDNTGLSTLNQIPSVAKYEELLDRYGERSLKSIVGSNDGTGGYAVPPSILDTLSFNFVYAGLLGATTKVNTIRGNAEMPTLTVSGLRTKADTRNDHYRSTVSWGSVELNSRPLEFNIPFSRSFMEDSPDSVKSALEDAIAEAMVEAHHERIVTGSLNDSISGILPSGANTRALSSTSGSLNFATLSKAKFALPWRARSVGCNSVLIGSSASGELIESETGEDVSLSVGNTIKNFDDNIMWFESETIPDNILVLGDMRSYLFSFGNLRIKSFQDSYSGENGVLSASVHSAGGVMYPDRFHVINVT